MDLRNLIVKSILDRQDDKEMADPTKPTELQQAIARLREGNYVKAVGLIGAPVKERQDTLAACDAAEAVTVEGKTAVHWWNQYHNEKSLANLYKRKSEQAEAELADTKKWLAEKNETANVFMKQVRKLQAELAQQKRICEGIDHERTVFIGHTNTLKVENAKLREQLAAAKATALRELAYTMYTGEHCTRNDLLAEAERIEKERQL